MKEVISTERLIIHQWRDEDREPFALLNADPEVMRFFPSVMTREATNAMVDKLINNYQRDGMCLWPVSLRDGAFIGMVGIQKVEYLQPAVAPGVEIGWRLARKYWRNGFASEAAMACLKYGFEDVGLSEIISFTAEVNKPSQKVMQRIGMSYDPDSDFDHPRIDSGHELSPHVLYRISR